MQSLAFRIFKCGSMISFPWKRRTLERMLSDLAECGIGLRDGDSVEWLYHEQTPVDPLVSRKALKKGGYEAVLIALGGERLTEDHQILDGSSDDVWHFDIEFIEDHGAYVTIAERLCRMTRGDFRCEQIRDYVDVDAGIAWMELTCDGQTERLDLKVDNDWTDGKIFTYLQDRLIQTGSNRRYAAQSLGQDMLLVCLSPGDLARLNRVTGMRFEPC